MHQNFNQTYQIIISQKLNIREKLKARFMRRSSHFRPDQGHNLYRNKRANSPPYNQRQFRQNVVEPRNSLQKAQKQSQKYEKGARTNIRAFNQQPSDIRNHVRFLKIKINPDDYNKFINILIDMLEKQIGPVLNVQKQSEQSSPAVHSPYEQINILVGFKYDLDAYNYYNEDRIFQITYENQKIEFKPKPTPVFQSMLPILKQRKIIQRPSVQIKLTKPPILRQKRSISISQQQSRQRRKKRRRSVSSSSSSKSSRSSRSSESSSQSKHKKRRHSRQKNRKRKVSKSIQSSRSLSRFSKSDLTSVLIWGIPYFVPLKQVLQDLKQIKGGPYDPQQFRWQYVQNSSAVFLKIKLQHKKAQHLLQLGKKGLTISSYPVVITSSSLGTIGLRDSLKQFQILLHFPSKVHSYHVYKYLYNVSKVVQLSSEQKLSEGKQNSFLVTLSSSSVASDLKKMVKVSDVVISPPYQGQLVFRPTKNTLLPPLK